MRKRRKVGVGSSASTPIELDDAYRRAVEKLDSLPQNQSGADKSWVERTIRDWRDHYARATR